MKKNKALRQKLKKIYALKKKQDVQQVGLKKNDLVQALHLQRKLPVEKRDQEVVKKTAEGLQAVSKERRVRDDFPSFAKFYNYIVDPKNNFTTQDISEL